MNNERQAKLPGEYYRESGALKYISVRENGPGGCSPSLAIAMMVAKTTIHAC